MVAIISIILRIEIDLTSRLLTTIMAYCLTKIRSRSSNVIHTNRLILEMIDS